MKPTSGQRLPLSKVFLDSNPFSSHLLTLVPGLAKAQYTVGYFTESGIGCRPDPLEANVWYVKAADEGDQRAIQRIAAIRAAASGEEPLVPKGRAAKTGTSAKGTEVLTKPQVSKDEKDCIVM